jgi:hypothetical protein
MFADNPVHIDSAFEYVHGEWASSLKDEREPHALQPFQNV